MEPLGEIETVFVNVVDVEKAAAFWHGILGVEFEPVVDFTLPDGTQCRSAWAPKYGLELIEQMSPRLGVEGLRGFSLRVRDIDSAKASMAEKQIPIVSESQLERAREHEVIYKLGGFRFILTQHDDYE